MEEVKASTDAQLLNVMPAGPQLVLQHFMPADCFPEILLGSADYRPQVS